MSSPPSDVSPAPSSPPTDDIASLYASLKSQSTILLAELALFTTHLSNCTSSSLPPPANLTARFQADILRESSLLQHHGSLLNLDTPLPTNALTSGPQMHRTAIARAQRQMLDTEDAAHRIRSSNIPFLGSVWEEVKRSCGVVGVRKHVRYLPPGVACPVGAVSRRRNLRARGRSGSGMGVAGVRTVDKDMDPVTVDVIVQRGRVWVKMFTKSLEWVLMDLAREGCVEVGGSARGSESEEKSDEGDVEAMEGLKLVKMAREFLSAARIARVGEGHEHPKVHFHLTKIERGASPDVDVVLKHMEGMGIVVRCADDLSRRDQTLGAESDLNVIFDQLISSPPAATATDTVNLDCTILIALISDISQLEDTNIRIPDHYEGKPAGQDIVGQLASECRDPLLLNHIYPILRGKKLICTSRTVGHLRNIVQIMGSSTETKRSNIFLAIGPEDRRPAEELRQSLQHLSKHVVPHDLQLPIRVVEEPNEGEFAVGQTGRLEQEVMRRLSGHARLSPLNRSVFFNGWQAGITTVSLNRVVSEWLSRAIDGTLDEIELEQGIQGDIATERNFRGPKMLICGRERSLLGTDKL